MRLKLTPAPVTTQPTFSVVGEVTRADMELVASKRRPAPPLALTRLTNRHHAVARLLAVGTPQTQVAIITGLTAQRISFLQTDTSFKELVQFYRDEVTDEYRTMNAQLAGIGEDALAELRERLETEPEKMSNNFLLDLVTKVADRTGNGPTSTTKSEVNVTFDLAERMRRAREAAQAAIAGTARDITPEPTE